LQTRPDGEVFENAGFKNIREQEVSTQLNAGTVERFWEMTTEIAAPFVNALNKADETLRKKIKDEVFELVNQHYPEGKVSIQASAIVISGEK
jgi:hypothetical protein